MGNNLQFIIGELNLDEENIGRYDVSPEHKFIIINKNPELVFHSGFVNRHEEIVSTIKGIDPSDRRIIIGGGRLYVSNDGILTLDSKSYKYGGVPIFVGEKYAKLLIPKLQEIGIPVSNVSIDLHQNILNPIWEELEFINLK